VAISLQRDFRHSAPEKRWREQKSKRQETRQANTTSSQKKNTTSKHYISRDVLVAGSLRSCRVPMVLVSAGISKHNRLRAGVGHFRSRLHKWRMAAQPDCSGR